MTRSQKIIIVVGAALLAVAAFFAVKGFRSGGEPEGAVGLSAVKPECITSAVELETGRKEYPRSEKYAHLPWLGQLFTASDCGPERVGKIFPDGMYRAGSKVWVNGAPSTALREALAEIGYVCAEEAAGPACGAWRLVQPVPVSQLLKLKPFAAELSADDCVLCG